MEYLNLAIKAIFVENILLAFFLGMCTFLACSKKVDTATGLGLTVIFVLTITVPTNWAINNFLLKPGALAWITPNDANSFFATMDLTFFSPLTKNGLENSVELIKHLEKEKINKIYSSPYIRTLQTINPYSKKYNINPKLDYSLTELYQEDNIPKKSYQITLPEYIAESFNFDKECT